MSSNARLTHSTPVGPNSSFNISPPKDPASLDADYHNEPTFSPQVLNGLHRSQNQTPTSRASFPGGMTTPATPSSFWGGSLEDFEVSRVSLSSVKTPETSNARVITMSPVSTYSTNYPFDGSSLTTGIQKDITHPSKQPLPPTSILPPKLPPIDFERDEIYFPKEELSHFPSPLKEADDHNYDILGESPANTIYSSPSQTKNKSNEHSKILQPSRDVSSPEKSVRDKDDKINDNSHEPKSTSFSDAHVKPSDTNGFEMAYIGERKNEGQNVLHQKNPEMLMSHEDIASIKSKASYSNSEKDVSAFEDGGKIRKKAKKHSKKNENEKSLGLKNERKHCENKKPVEGKEEEENSDENISELKNNHLNKVKIGAKIKHRKNISQYKDKSEEDEAEPEEEEKDEEEKTEKEDNNEGDEDYTDDYIDDDDDDDEKEDDANEEEEEEEEEDEDNDDEEDEDDEMEEEETNKSEYGSQHDSSENKEDEADETEEEEDDDDQSATEETNGKSEVEDSKDETDEESDADTFTNDDNDDNENREYESSDEKAESIKSKNAKRKRKNNRENESFLEKSVRLRRNGKKKEAVMELFLAEVDELRETLRRKEEALDKREKMLKTQEIKQKNAKEKAERREKDNEPNILKSKLEDENEPEKEEKRKTTKAENELDEITQQVIEDTIKSAEAEWREERQLLNDSFEEELRKKNEELQKVKSQLKKEKANGERMKQWVDTLKKEKKAAVQEKEELNEKLQAMQKRSGVLERTVNVMKKEKKEKEEEVKKNEEERIREKESIRREMERMKATLRDKTKEDNLLRQEQQQDIEAKAKEIKELRKRMQEQTEQIANLQQKLSTTQHQKDELLRFLMKKEEQEKKEKQEAIMRIATEENEQRNEQKKVLERNEMEKDGSDSSSSAAVPQSEVEKSTQCTQTDFPENVQPEKKRKVTFQQNSSQPQFESNAIEASTAGTTSDAELSVPCSPPFSSFASSPTCKQPHFQLQQSSEQSSMTAIPAESPKEQYSLAAQSYPSVSSTSVPAVPSSYTSSEHPITLELNKNSLAQQTSYLPSSTQPTTDNSVPDGCFPASRSNDERNEIVHNHSLNHHPHNYQHLPAYATYPANSVEQTSPKTQMNLQLHSQHIQSVPTSDSLSASSSSFTRPNMYSSDTIAASTQLDSQLLTVTAAPSHPANIPTAIPPLSSPEALFVLPTTSSHSIEPFLIREPSSTSSSLPAADQPHSVSSALPHFPSYTQISDEPPPKQSLAHQKDSNIHQIESNSDGLTQAAQPESPKKLNSTDHTPNRKRRTSKRSSSRHHRHAHSTTRDPKEKEQMPRVLSQPSSPTKQAVPETFNHQESHQRSDRETEIERTTKKQTSSSPSKNKLRSKSPEISASFLPSLQKKETIVDSSLAGNPATSSTLRHQSNPDHIRILNAVIPMMGDLAVNSPADPSLDMSTQSAASTNSGLSPHSLASSLASLSPFIGSLPETTAFTQHVFLQLLNALFAEDIPPATQIGNVDAMCGIHVMEELETLCIEKRRRGEEKLEKKEEDERTVSQKDIHKMEPTCFGARLMNVLLDISEVNAISKPWAHPLSGSRPTDNIHLPHETRSQKSHSNVVSPFSSPKRQRRLNASSASPPQRLRQVNSTDEEPKMIASLRRSVASSKTSFINQGQASAEASATSSSFDDFGEEEKHRWCLTLLSSLLLLWLIPMLHKNRRSDAWTELKASETDSISSSFTPFTERSISSDASSASEQKTEKDDCNELLCICLERINNCIQYAPSGLVIPEFFHNHGIAFISPLLLHSRKPTSTSTSFHSTSFISSLRIVRKASLILLSLARFTQPSLTLPPPLLPSASFASSSSSSHSSSYFLATCSSAWLQTLLYRCLHRCLRYNFSVESEVAPSQEHENIGSQSKLMLSNGYGEASFDESASQLNDDIIKSLCIIIERTTKSHEIVRTLPTRSRLLRLLSEYLRVIEHNTRNTQNCSESLSREQTLLLANLRSIIRNLTLLD
ncbi:uncharacterized protein MONOS_12381 [Monocercomonoides exilis]|uniref:uncharacterized protein n=1 Tax=Monocercomonoides exilis TaxID=2049356 RepID=UPI00355A5D30|nr:hypothetical protein MONOS_12381 [Monocercomonoides exilis]|eukprot:MONOS_12381.1-p1 / transcript=MONOS_12381.1 / gene=MONOS_12381 / organism=Monocercomonoides_exilis_PA203 / gene_product=unspecified product / transcript_product=unspecified product / location=Mono_scaffold00681:21401-27385(+) / protein_length=1995 / sequence_SO=supercontig / SO=protein_coding / is_pseudo=false